MSVALADILPALPTTSVTDRWLVLVQYLDRYHEQGVKAIGLGTGSHIPVATYIRVCLAMLKEK